MSTPDQRDGMNLPDWPLEVLRATPLPAAVFTADSSLAWGNPAWTTGGGTAPGGTGLCPGSNDRLRQHLHEMHHQGRPQQTLLLTWGDGRSCLCVLFPVGPPDQHHVGCIGLGTATVPADPQTAPARSQSDPHLRAVMAKLPPLPPGILVIVVDDNAMARQLASSLLDHIKVGSVAVADGATAVSLVIAGGADLILMDCMMPGMDGYAATRAIRAFEQRSGRPRIPVVAMTADSSNGIHARCLESGMDDHAEKPIGHQGLHAVVTRWCADRSPRAQPIALRQLAVVLRAFAGRVPAMCRQFIDDTTTRLAGMERALADRDLTELRQCAHAMKGSAASLGAVDLARCAGDLETQALAGNHETLPALFVPVARSARETMALVAQIADGPHP